MKIRLNIALLVILSSFGLFTHISQSVAEEMTAENLVELQNGVFRCPAPREVKCKAYAESVGPWKENGGYRPSFNTSFAPYNQCANVIKLSSRTNRLLCCYKECGVLYMDVKFSTCKKESDSEFHCQ